ncbi:D-alanyl-D-alanine carboxypeptidase family protein [Anaeromicropila populeti]|uniref:D-alanyl-D-alanine carboxypeptidase (Penicillin-binding protein 5/6) n=1 Tax=Anaeromicropila populeti TaxID=37658 RepID=A0A1I6L8U6_9FIRM|nr:serine hydrolase [Anaeromicropila populeti]SFR99638.1 D-alanyl-D-alanine carboxypeptidase (penicillin-binding protein 5/6) [Anaeromicropila populeti]
MKKVLLSFSMLCALLLIGCDQVELYIPYDSAASFQGNAMTNEVAEDSEELFSEDLCLIPLKEDVDKDGNLNGIATLLVDITDKETIFADNVYEKVYPASITKIVTALVVLEHCDLSEMVTVSHDAANITEAGAKKCGFLEGDKIKLLDLLTAFLVYSGNDAGAAIADHVAGSVEAFAQLMNEEAKKVGAVHSNFVNPHGLHDDNHYTTAYDIYLFFNECLKHEEFVKIINNSSVDISYSDADGNAVKKTFTTTNRYLNGKEAMPDGITVLGGKTGTTSKAGSCVVIYSKDKKNHEYISLILKTDSGDALFSQMSYLLKMINR